MAVNSDQESVDCKPLVPLNTAEALPAQPALPAAAPAAPFHERVPWGRNVEDMPGTMAAFASAREFQETLRDDDRRRSFIKVISSSSARGNLMPFPAEFSRKHMPFGTRTVTLIDHTGRSWPVNWTWKPSQNHPGFSAKWRSFCVHHQLVRGDVCLVVLTNPNRLVFSVRIFKRKRLKDEIAHLQKQQQSGRIPDRYRIVPSSRMRSRDGSDSEDRMDDDQDYVMGMSEQESLDEEDRELDEEEFGEEKEEQKGAEMRVSLRTAPSLSSAEHLSIRLVVRREKSNEVEKLLLGSSGTILQKTQSGALNASVREAPLLASILKLALPLDDGVPFY